MLTTPALRRPPPLPALTGVRFFAALDVVLYHYASDALADAH
jgi:peptidoglycan/LPS O-acetylase OafA/YrhL